MENLPKDIEVYLPKNGIEGLDWREQTIMYWVKLGEEIYFRNKVNLDQCKKILLKEFKMQENPQHLDDLLEGLQKANLITINGNKIGTGVLKGE